ncbi:response regulator [Alkalinema sp. FACHB-956]|uniref:response regulator transcription factor n=1 Tax=Alkalinema sp. FACHB-956 TaxID=2692768 RepID=UPI001682A7DE|nr:response regulator [Alkalinema sp. FACHB-956]MBD2325370.1 response regulator transcription factor [Alkalinema sp. FACHB-956]
MNRILLAEDEVRLAAFVEKGLVRNGFVVRIAEDGEMALDLLRKEEFDLLLLDVGLPLKDGWAVLEEMQQQTKKVPVIVVTAMSDNGNHAQALAMGAHDFVMKPFKFSELLVKIQALLNAE